MVDTVEQEVVASKSILKRRIINNTNHINIDSNTTIINNNNHNERSAEEPAPKRDDYNCAENISSKRNVTFNDTISVKNDKNLVVKKPLKLELVIENWKSSNAKTLPEIVQPDPGIVRRLVDEFNIIDDPLTDNPEIDSALSEEVKEVNEDESTEIQMDIPLCEALETVNLTADNRVKVTAANKSTDGKFTLPDRRTQNLGKVNQLVNMFNSKSTSNTAAAAATAEQRASETVVDF